MFTSRVDPDPDRSSCALSRCADVRQGRTALPRRRRGPPCPGPSPHIGGNSIRWPLEWPPLPGYPLLGGIQQSRTASQPEQTSARSLLPMCAPARRSECHRPSAGRGDPDYAPRMAQSALPVLFVVDHDPKSLAVLLTQLSRRFGNNFTVRGATSSTAALAALRAMAAAT